MKICLVSSHGGHLTDLLQMREAFAGHEVLFVTYHSQRNEEAARQGKAYFTDNIGTNLWRMLRTIPWALIILLRERPHLVVSTGAEIAIPFFYLAKLLCKKTIFIESAARVKSLSGTGRIVYPVSDVFFVQWEHHVKSFPKARYEGALL